MLNRIREWFEDRRIEREQRQQRKRADRLRSRPCLEMMEERVVPAVNYDWLGTTSDNPGVNANWWNESVGGVSGKPTAVDTVWFGDDSTGAKILNGNNFKLKGTFSFASVYVGNDWNNTIELNGGMGGATALWNQAPRGTGNLLQIDNGNTLTVGEFDWYNGKIGWDTVGRGIISIIGTNGTLSHWGSSTAIGDLELGADVKIGNGTNTNQPIVQIGPMTSGDNVKLEHGATIYVSKATLQLAQTSNPGTSGGISTDGTTGSKITIDSGGLNREFASRSGGDAPSSTPVIIAVPVYLVENKGAQEALFVGDSLGLSITGVDSNGYSLKNSQGVIQLTGGSNLALSGNYQSDNSGFNGTYIATIKATRPVYNLTQNTVTMGGTNTTFTMTSAEIDTAGYLSRNDTGGATYGVFVMTGDVTANALTIRTAINGASSGDKDQIQISGKLTPQTSLTLDVTENGTLGSGSWNLLTYGSINSSLTPTYNWYLPNGSAGTALTPAWTGDNSHSGGWTVSH